MKKIDADDFIAFCKNFEGQTIPTLGKRAKFTVAVTEEGLVFTPLSKPRQHTKAYVEKVLSRYAQDGSMSASDYRFTVNASYMLPLVALYVERKKNQRSTSTVAQVDGGRTEKGTKKPR